MHVLFHAQDRWGDLLLARGEGGQPWVGGGLPFRPHPPRKNVHVPRKNLCYQKRKIASKLSRPKKSWVCGSKSLCSGLCWKTWICSNLRSRNANLHKFVLDCQKMCRRKTKFCVSWEKFLFYFANTKFLLCFALKLGKKFFFNFCFEASANFCFNFCSETWEKFFFQLLLWSFNKLFFSTFQQRFNFCFLKQKIFWPEDALTKFWASDKTNFSECRQRIKFYLKKSFFFLEHERSKIWMSQKIFWFKINLNEKKIKRKKLKEKN